MKLSGYIQNQFKLTRKLSMHLSKIILALFISISAPLTWASVPESKVSLAKELLRVNGEAELMEVMISEGFKAGFQPIADQLQLTLGDCADPVIGQLKISVTGLLIDIVSSNNVLEKMAQMYAENFEEQELQELITWSQSPIGLKMKSVAPTLARKSMEMSNEIMMTAMPKFQSEMESVMASASANAQQCMARN